jgi:hypothetical protein
VERHTDRFVRCTSRASRAEGAEEEDGDEREEEEKEVMVVVVEVEVEEKKAGVE